MSTLTLRGTTASERLVGAGISLIVVVGLIHLIDAPGDLQEAPYQGLLFLANFFGALTAAIGIYRGTQVGLEPGSPRCRRGFCGVRDQPHGGSTRVAR